MNNTSNLRAARAIALSGVDQQIVTGSAVVLGVVITDEAAGSIRIHVHNGTDNTGPHVAALGANSGAQDTVWYGPNGIHCPDGVYIDVMSGTPSGSIFVRD